MNQLPESDDSQKKLMPSEYEKPRIESVLTPEQLEREVLYAGPGGTPGGRRRRRRGSSS